MEKRAVQRRTVTCDYSTDLLRSLDTDRYSLMFDFLILKHSHGKFLFV